MKRQASVTVRESNSSVGKKVTVFKAVYLTLLLLVSALFIAFNLGHQDIWYGIMLYSIFNVAGLKIKPSKFELPLSTSENHIQELIFKNVSKNSPGPDETKID